jgi:hypothetical protein
MQPKPGRMIASVSDVMFWIEMSDRWDNLPPVVRAFYYWRAVIMSKASTALFLGTLTIVFIGLVSYALQVPVWLVVLILLGGVLIGVLMSWAINHNHR